MSELQRISDSLGESIHTAFRKGTDHPSAWTVWKAIDEMPTEEWAGLLDWLRYALRLPALSGDGHDKDADDCPLVSAPHALRLVDAPKMDARDLVRAVCSCGDYSSSNDTAYGATRSWASHYLAKTRGVGR